MVDNNKELEENESKKDSKLDDNEKEILYDEFKIEGKKGKDELKEIEVDTNIDDSHNRNQEEVNHEENDKLNEDDLERQSECEDEEFRDGNFEEATNTKGKNNKVKDRFARTDPIGVVKRILIMAPITYLIMLMTFFFSTANYNEDLFFKFINNGEIVILSIIPIFIIYALITLITDRLWLGTFITSILFFGMGVGNKYKLIYRDEPFNFMDVKLLNEASDMAGKYEISITSEMILMIVGIIVVTFILKKWMGKSKNNIFFRLGSIIIISVLSVFLLNNIYFDKDLYREIGEKEYVTNIWSETQQYQSKGFVYPFVHSIYTSKDRVLEGYDEELAIKLLKEKKCADIPEEKKINFVSIMLEAYNDFSIFEDVEFEIDPYENFHRIQEEGYSGNLITNVFAGGTINTEWSYLTGINSHPPKYVTNSNSNVWYFKDQGYTTEFMHPNYGWFYNRRNVNDYLGFDNFLYYENKFEDINEEFLEDNEFFDYIIEGYEKNKKTKKPYFHFSTTYQNHGPYSGDKIQENHYLKYKKEYDEYNSSYYHYVNNYLYGISKTDEALDKLVDYLDEEDEPIVLVLFGDHNPWLGDENKSYEMLGINMDVGSEEGFVNYYRTPYVFWANKKAKEVLDKDFAEKGNDVSPNFLMAELFEYIGYEGNNYMQYSSDVRKSFTVNHDMYFKTKNGYTQKLDKKEDKVWKEFNSVQYYYIRHFMYNNK